jgi:hypothetical protein
MEKNRLEAFSDGVLAIIITIMVLELKVPHGADWAAIKPLVPVFLSYVLSFIYVGIYWNNHHHLIKACRRVNARIMWANLHLLFWLSLLPRCMARCCCCRAPPISFCKTVLSPNKVATRNSRSRWGKIGRANSRSRSTQSESDFHFSCRGLPRLSTSALR